MVKKKVCYINPNSFTVYRKTGNIYKDIAVDAEITSDTSNYELYRLLPRGNKKWCHKVITYA